MRTILALLLLVCIGCVEKSPPEQTYIVDQVFEKSCLVNSASSIWFGEYKVSKKVPDLVHPKWEVTKNGESLLVSDMVTCLQKALDLSEGRDQ